MCLTFQKYEIKFPPTQPKNAYKNLNIFQLTEYSETSQ